MTDSCSRASGLTPEQLAELSQLDRLTPAQIEALEGVMEANSYEAEALPGFVPAPLRTRADGWSPRRQEDFIRALAETGCVREAAKRVRMGVSGAYALRARDDAQSFRYAWDAAIDMAMPRMSDAAISRAIHGVPVPIFYRGEQVGETRRFDERLVMFLLRYRDPVRYGRWRDRIAFDRHPDGPALSFHHRLSEMWLEVFGKLKERLSAVGHVWRREEDEDDGGAA
jgi:hypothetical protein